MNSEQQFNDIANEPSESENRTKLSLFMSHMEQKNVEIERDLLLLEVASRHGLSRDLRFQYFIEHCKQYSTRQLLTDSLSIVEKYERRMSMLSNDLVNEDWSDPTMEMFGSVVSMLQTLIISRRIWEVDQCFKSAFPEYYRQNTKVTGNE
jgi:hypothetical protein